MATEEAKVNAIVKAIANNVTTVGMDTNVSGSLTMGQKLFATTSAQPNLPKPKTLFFVYFHLNPKINDLINDKTIFLKKLIGGNTVSDTINTKESALMSEIYGNGNNIKYADEILSDKSVYNELGKMISKMVKEYEKPHIEMKTTELNEYNRKRVIYNGVGYNDVKIKFFDVKENPAQEFFLNYLKLINNDLLGKSHEVWTEAINNNEYQNTLLTYGLDVKSNFRLIDAISFIEYYQNRYLVYTVENPAITKIDFGNCVMGDFTANTVDVTFKYEGINNDLITSDLNASTKDKNNTKSLINHKFESSPSSLTLQQLATKNNVNGISRNLTGSSQLAKMIQKNGPTLTSSIATDIVNITKRYINTGETVTWDNLKDNLVNTIYKYGYADEVNGAYLAEKNIDALLHKEGSDRWKFLMNASTDSSSIIGKTSSFFINGEDSFSARVGSFFHPLL